MSFSLMFTPDEDILTFYDIFGADFWVRVLNKEGDEENPLQQEISFSGKVNERTMQFEYAPGEEAKADLILGLLKELLTEDDYKYTPFLKPGANIKTVRYTFQPSSSRFVFQKTALPALTLFAHKARALAARREIMEIMSDKNKIYGIEQVWQSQHMDMQPLFNELKRVIRAFEEETIDEEALINSFEAALKDVPGKISITSGITGMKQAIADDAVLSIHQHKLDTLEQLEFLTQVVIKQREREKKQVAEERAKLLGQ